MSPTITNNGTNRRSPFFSSSTSSTVSIKTKKKNFLARSFSFLNSSPASPTADRIPDLTTLDVGSTRSLPAKSSSLKAIKLKETVQLAEVAAVCEQDHVQPPNTFTAFASAKDGKSFVAKNIELPALGRNDVAVAILCCSVCFTDTMYAAMIEGQVVGHEIIGRVEFKGEDVTNVDIGDTIGFGYIRTTCLECQFCQSGQENMCPKRTTFTDGIGGFANASVWDSRFVYKIPAVIEPRHAGPLTCAGATVFAALYGYNVSPTSTVGIVGLGGLGHLALKFAKAWGCKVVAISSSESKRADSMRFGAHEFICTKDPITTPTKMDYILNTTSGDLPWDIFIGLLETNGTLINMGVSAKGSMEIPAMPALFNQLKVVGSLVASRHVMKKMLDFAALHNIRPEIEELDMGTEGCKEAVRRVVEQQARYRVVLNVPEHLSM